MIYHGKKGENPNLIVSIIIIIGVIAFIIAGMLVMSIINGVPIF
ncbi:MAG: hypothetical protein ACTSVV_19000 [Promethearchaeota archaeon]